MKKSTAALLLALVLTATTVHSSEQPRRGGTLIYGRGADSVTLEPGKSDDLESCKVIESIYEGLVRYKDDSTEVEPALAESWEASSDGLQWTFHLRRRISFHDRSPFNADAVVFSFMRMIDPHHPHYRDDFKCASFTFQHVRKVEAADSTTVRITLEKPFAPFLQNMAMVYARIVSPAAVAKWRGEFEKHPVGTGPFKFVEWTSGDRILLEANRDYWAGVPHLDKLVYKSTLSNRDRVLELKTSAIDVMDGIGPEHMSEIMRTGAIHLDVKPGLNVAYLAMNTEKKPFDQAAVRRAINHAINKQNLVKLIYRDLAIPVKNPMPPTLWGYNDDIRDYDYNLTKARELLAEAGYGSGFETTMWVMTAPRLYMPQPQELAGMIKTNLAAAGIKLNIVSLNWDSYLTRTSNGEHEMCLIGWVGDNGDPDNFLYVLLDEDNAVKPYAENLSFFRNSGLHSILLKAQQEPDRSERAKLYQEAQALIHQEAPWVPLAHVQQVLAFRDPVHGVIQHPFGVVRFHKAWKATE